MLEPVELAKLRMACYGLPVRMREHVLPRIEIDDWGLDMLQKHSLTLEFGRWFLDGLPLVGNYRGYEYLSLLVTLDCDVAWSYEVVFHTNQEAFRKAVERAVLGISQSNSEIGNHLRQYVSLESYGARYLGCWRWST